MKKKIAKKDRTNWKRVCAELTAKHQDEINRMEMQVATYKQQTDYAKEQLSDERKFTETFARMLQLVTLLDPIRAQDKSNALDVYGKLNPAFATNRCCEWKIPTRGDV